jgi:hypothetical protein
MGIGVGIALAALGAILAFAVHASLGGLDLAVVGWILMVAGVLGIVLDLVMFAPRRRVVPAPTYVEPAVPGRPVVRRDLY